MKKSLKTFYLWYSENLLRDNDPFCGASKKEVIEAIEFYYLQDHAESGYQIAFEKGWVSEIKCVLVPLSIATRCLGYNPRD